MKTIHLATAGAVLLHGYILFFAVKIIDHGGQNVFQIAKGYIVGYCF
jgi:hypothetical protein